MWRYLVTEVRTRFQWIVLTNKYLLVAAKYLQYYNRNTIVLARAARIHGELLAPRMTVNLAACSWRTLCSLWWGRKKGAPPPPDINTRTTTCQDFIQHASPGKCPGFIFSLSLFVAVYLSSHFRVVFTRILYIKAVIVYTQWFCLDHMGMLTSTATTSR